MHKYGESKTTRIFMATIRHVTSSSGLRAAWFLLNREYVLKLDVLELIKLTNSLILVTWYFKLTDVKPVIIFVWFEFFCLFNVYRIVKSKPVLQW
jgi:hypothetical protein